jgi:hypothetical protein
MPTRGGSVARNSGTALPQVVEQRLGGHSGMRLQGGLLGDGRLLQICSSGYRIGILQIAQLDLVLRIELLLECLGIADLVQYATVEGLLAAEITRRCRQIAGIRRQTGDIVVHQVVIERSQRLEDACGGITVIENLACRQ